MPGLAVLFIGIALVIIYVVTRPAPDAESVGTPNLPVDQSEAWPER
jgi:hypothetical protein